VTEATRSDVLTAASAGAQAVLYLVTGVLTLVWLWRARRNLVTLGLAHRARWAQRWTVGGWFLPFANVVLPFLVLNDVERVSRAGATPGSPDVRADRDTSRPSPHPLPALWFVTWIAVVVTRVVSRVGVTRHVGTTRASTLAFMHAHQRAATWSAVHGVAFAAAAVLFALVVTRVMRSQRARAAERSMLWEGPCAPTPPAQPA